MLAAAGASVLNAYHAIVTGQARKAAKYPYPTPYAPLDAQNTSITAYAFNCAQRAHANYLEQLPTFLTTLLLSGLKYPVVSAGLGATWVVARTIYLVGYTSSTLNDGGKKRLRGSFAFLPQITLLGLTVYSAYSTLMK